MISILACCHGVKLAHMPPGISDRNTGKVTHGTFYKVFRSRLIAVSCNSK